MLNINGIYNYELIKISSFNDMHEILSIKISNEITLNYIAFGAIDKRFNTISNSNSFIKLDKFDKLSNIEMLTKKFGNVSEMKWDVAITLATERYNGDYITLFITQQDIIIDVKNINDLSKDDAEYIVQCFKYILYRFKDVIEPNLRYKNEYLELFNRGIDVLNVNHIPYIKPKVKKWWQLFNI